MADQSVSMAMAEPTQTARMLSTRFIMNLPLGMTAMEKTLMTGMRYPRVVK
jgi:hypothetical protein